MVIIRPHLACQKQSFDKRNVQHQQGGLPHEFLHIANANFY